MADRRESAINDPRFWVSITAVLLTITLFTLSIAVNKLSDIDVAVQSIRDNNTRQSEKIGTLEKEVKELKDENRELKQSLVGSEKRQTDYNFTLADRLKEIEVMLKMKGKG